jgi:preprotein translocase subunit SecF
VSETRAAATDAAQLEAEERRQAVERSQREAQDARRERQQKKQVATKAGEVKAQQEVRVAEYREGEKDKADMAAQKQRLVSRLERELGEKVCARSFLCLRASLFLFIRRVVWRFVWRGCNSKVLSAHRCAGSPSRRRCGPSGSTSP